MLAVYFSQAETGEMLKCYLCNKNNDDGYFLHPKTDSELNFLELKFGDPSNWLICDECIHRFRELQPQLNLRFWSTTARWCD